MMIDFDKFSDITASAYPGGTYTLEETLEVFRYFFQQYEECIGEVHPPIRASQIARICQDMPYIFLQDRGESYIDVTPEDYTELIDTISRQNFAIAITGSITSFPGVCGKCGTMQPVIKFGRKTIWRTLVN